MAKCRSNNTEKKQRNLIPYKPGQSGNPQGRPRGSRNKLAEDFVADLHDSWKVLGKAAITTVACEELQPFASNDHISSINNCANT